MNHHDDCVCKTMAVVLDIDPEMLTENASPETISSWDSMSHLNLVMALESEFGISLSAEDALEMNTVAAVRRVLSARGAKI